MTTSPYDNLPTGKSEEVIPEIQETSLSESTQQEPSEPPHYVDVDLEDHKKPVSAPAPAPVDPPKPIPPAPRNIVKTTPLKKTPRYTSVNVQNMWHLREYILPFEETLLVPDTMPDMECLLFAEGTVRLTKTGKPHYGKDDFLSGDITVYSVYQPAAVSGGPVDVVKSVIPFRTDQCWNGAEGDSFRPEVSIKSIAAERINERKFAAKGELRIRFTEIAGRDLKVFSGSDDNDLILAENAVHITDLSFETEEATEISQDVNIRENQPSPVKILKSSIRIIENHRQITSGKLVINASIHSQVLYLGEEDGSRELCCLTNKTDFTMFVLVKDHTSPDLIRISFRSDDLAITIENQNQFLLSGKVSALISGYQDRVVKTVCDAYHKQRDIQFDAMTQELSSVKDTVSGELSAREVIDLSESDQKPEKLLCGHALPPTLKGRPEKGRLVIDGNIPVTILALDENERPFVISASLPLRGSFETDAAGDDLTACLTAALKDFWFSEINSRQLEINISLSITAWVIGRETFYSLDNMCVVETDVPQRRVPMAVYVTGPQDTLWDVAKRYKSDIGTIVRLNQLDPHQPLPEGMKLFVSQ